MKSRTARNHKLCANLQNAGIDISYDALLEMFPHSVITRAHYAKFLLAPGYVKSHTEAFDRYLGDCTPYFVPRENITPKEVIEVTRKAGGVPILAHPTLYKLGKEQLDILVSTLTEQGLMGREGIYSTYTPAEERQIKALAEKYHLLQAAVQTSMVPPNPDWILDVDMAGSTFTIQFLPTLRKHLCHISLLIFQV